MSPDPVPVSTTGEPRPLSPLERVGRVAYACFGMLPKRGRHRVVRWVAPTFSAGASIFIEDDNGHILLVLHPYRKLWSPPGGLLGRNESPAAAALRELAEEVGAEVTIVEECGASLQLDRRHVDFVFRVRLTPDSPPPRANSPEITAVRWFAPDALPQLDPETVETLIVAGYLPDRPSSNGG